MALSLWKNGKIILYNSPWRHCWSLLAPLAPLRGTQMAVLVPHRCQQTGVTPPSGSALSKAVPSKGGRLNNAMDYVFVKMDDLVNYARKVTKIVKAGSKVIAK